MKSRIIFTTILILALINSGCASKKNDPEAVILAYAEALNAGDKDAVLALFSDGLEFHDFGGLALGKGYINERLEKWLDWDAQYEAIDIEVNGNQAEWLMRVSWGGAISETKYETIVEDGRFTYMRELCVATSLGACESP